MLVFEQSIGLVEYGDVANLGLQMVQNVQVTWRNEAVGQLEV